MILEQERVEEIYEAALRRQQREADLMAQLRAGNTTIELLGLPPMAKQVEQLG